MGYIMDNVKHFEDSYDVIVIGGALAGLASALTLCSKGKKVLVLEQHNLPGGVATSFVRGGIEIFAEPPIPDADWVTVSTEYWHGAY